ncbi:hypothetical protein LZK73_21840 [Neorhizobium galegae]|nr:hypothetical protein LZK73_21840 [Neorhizobium galegae]
MLRNIGEDPVSTLGPTAKPNAQKAQSMLAEESINLQSQGYNFSTDMELTLDPNTSGEIVMPDNLLSFYPVGRSQWMQVQEGEGNRLYNALEGTFTFTAPVTVRAVLARPFNTLPQPVRWYLAVAASMRFANSENPGGASLRVTSQDLEQAKTNFEKFDRRLRQGGLRRHNPHFQRMRGNR